MKRSVIIGFDAKRAFCNATGLGNYSRNIIRAMVRHYPENTYYLFTPKITVKDFAEEISGYPHVKIITPKNFGLLSGSFWRSFLLKRLAKKYGLDVFHGLSNEIPAGMHKVAYTLCTVHDLIFMKEKLYYNLFDIFSFSRKTRYAVKHAHKLIAISRQTKKDLVELLQANPEKIEVVYQPLSPEFRHIPEPSEIEAARKNYRLPEQFILFVGRIEVRKNLQGILEALGQLKDRSHIPVVVVGKPTRFFRSIKDFIKIFRLSDRVIFPGQVSKEALPSFYRAATVLAYPSYHEGFGLPVLEAISMGTPVVCTDEECFREAGGKFPVYVDPRNAQSIAKGLEEVISLKPEFSPEDIFEHIYAFDEKKIADDLQAIYLRAFSHS